MRIIPAAIIVVVTLFSASFVEAATGIAARNKAVYGALDDYEGQHSEAVRSVSSPTRGDGFGEEQRGRGGDYTLAAQPKRISFQFGVERYAYKYQETMIDGEEFMNLKGTFVGICASMVYRPMNLDPYWAEFIDHFIVDARMAWAKLDYTGGVSFSDGGSVPLTMSGTPDVVGEIRGMFAKDFALDTFTLTPFFGMGYRYLRDDSSGITSKVDYLGVTYDVKGYLRESNYIYLPLGLEITRRLPGQWTLGVTGEYDIFAWGQQKSHIDTELGSPIGNSQNKGYGMRASARLAKDFENVTFSFEPFVRYWSIDDSDWSPTEYCAEGETCGGAIEPKNTTREVGAKVGMTF